MVQSVLCPKTNVGRRGVLAGAAVLLGGLSGRRPARAEVPDHQRYLCGEIGCLPYIYDPRRGDPNHGIPPGTAFADLPGDWLGPICGVGKHRFAPYG